MCRSFFLKSAGIQPAIVLKRDGGTGLFQYILQKFHENFFVENSQAASECYILCIVCLHIKSLSVMCCTLCVYTSKVCVVCLHNKGLSGMCCALCVYTSRVWVLCAVLCVYTHQGFKCYVLCVVCLHTKGLSVMYCELFVYTSKVWMLCVVRCIFTHRSFRNEMILTCFFFPYLTYLFFWSTPMFRNEILNQLEFVESSDLVFELLFINK